MRATPALLVLAACSTLLAACGKNSGAQQASGEAPAPAPPPPAAPTPEQIKAEVARLPAPYAGGDYEAGKAVFAQCAACHTVTDGGPNMTGPNLYGVFGRKAGTKAGFDYSDGLAKAGWTWEPAKIDAWITDPRAMIPETRMTFPGLRNPKDRANVIAYLKVATSPAG
jgi:cytochrome c